MVERLTKVNELLGKEIAEILKSELDLDVDVFITVTRVSVSRTLEHATVWISVLPDSERDAVLKKISQDIYHIQQMLNSRLVMRKIPKLFFKIDTTEERAEHIEKLLENVVKYEDEE